MKSGLRHVVTLMSIWFSFSMALSQANWRSGSGYVGLRTGFIQLEEVDDTGSWNLGLSAGMVLAPFLTLDGSVDFQASNFAVRYGGVDIQFYDLERKTTALQAGLTLSPWYRSPFQPYLTGGVGLYYSSYSHAELGGETVSDAGYYAGFGAEFLGSAFGEMDSDHVGNGFSVILDARWLFTREEPYLEQEIKADGRMLSVGLKFRF